MHQHRSPLVSEFRKYIPNRMEHTGLNNGERYQFRCACETCIFLMAYGDNFQPLVELVSKRSTCADSADKRHYTRISKPDISFV